jgi:hypothetical protein
MNKPANELPLSIAEYLVQPTKDWAGVTSMMTLGIIGNLLAALIQLITGNAIWLLIAVALAMVMVWLVYRLRKLRLVRVRVPLKMLVTPDKKPPKCAGLIVLVGPGRPGEGPEKQSAWHSIQYHRFGEDGATQRLRKCWLVSSEGEGGGLPYAQILKQEVEKLGIQVDVNSTVKDAFSIQEAYDAVRNVVDNQIPHDESKLKYDDIIVDVTGANKPMSIGAVLACEMRVKMQYMFGRKEGIASEPLLIQFEPDQGRPDLKV